MPNPHFDRFMELNEKGDIKGLVSEFVELGVKSVDQNMTDAEQEAFDDFRKWLTEPLAKEGPDKEKPARGAHFYAQFLEELLKYKAEVNMSLAEDVIENVKLIHEGKVPGTEAYANDPVARHELGSYMAEQSDKFKYIGSITGTIYTLLGDYPQIPLEDEDAKKYGLEPGTKINELIQKAGEDITREYLGNETIYSESDTEYMRRMGGELTTEISDYGLEFENGEFKPKKGNIDKDFLRDGYRQLDNEPVLDEDGDVQKNIVHYIAEPEKFVAGKREEHQHKMDKYLKNFDDLQNRAKKYLDQMDKLAAYKKNNSDEFNAMHEALADVAALSDFNTPKQIVDTLNRLNKTSAAYRARIDGSLFRGVMDNGRDRRDLSNTLVGFTKQLIEKLDEYKSPAFDRNLGLADQVKEFNTPVKMAEKKESAPEVKSEEMPVVKQKISVAELNKEEAKANKSANPERDEILKKREEIMNKRKENEKNGIASDNTNHVKKRGRGLE